MTKATSVGVKAVTEVLGVEANLGGLQESWSQTFDEDGKPVGPRKNTVEVTGLLGESLKDLTKADDAEFGQVGDLNGTAANNPEIGPHKAELSKGPANGSAGNDRGSPADDGWKDRGHGVETSPNCFVSGTLILRADGTSAPIESIEVGDEVMAFEELGPLEPCKVIDVLQRENSQVVEISGLKCTPKHRFLTADGEFKAVEDLNADTLLVDQNGRSRAAGPIKEVDGLHTVYNFTVERLHTYVAGGLRVHNIKVAPIILDLDGDGVELVGLDETSAFFDITGDGYRNRLAWAAADDGILAYDKQGDGEITDADEISFVDYVDGAQTDLEGLTHFDTNSDGVLDANDAEFESFGVWQDVDQDGVSDPGEFRSLSDMGIKSIELQSDSVVEERDDSYIYGSGFYTYSDGSVGAFADAALSGSTLGVREEADGSWTFQNAPGGDEIKQYFDDADRVVNLASLGFVGVISGGGDDFLEVGDDSSVLLHGGAGNDTLVGSGGDDWLVGGDGADSISAGAGNDTLLLDALDFTSFVSAGEGFDIAFISGDQGVVVDVVSTGIEVVYSSSGNDVIFSDSQTQLVVDGGGGNDTLTGSDLDDIIFGGIGSDSIHAGDGDDLLGIDADDNQADIDAGDGSDTIVVSDNRAVTIDLGVVNAESAIGNDGDDVFSVSGAGSSVLMGFGGHDQLSGGFGDDWISGGEGNDQLSGGDGQDSLFGEGGDDTLVAGAGDDTLSGGSNADTYVFGRGDGSDIVHDSHFEVGESYESVVERKVTYKYVEPSVSYSKSTRDTGGGGVGGDGGSERTRYRATVTYKSKTSVETEPEFTTITRYKIEQLDAGDDTLKFGAGITVTDLTLRLVGADLIVALNDTNDPTKPFEDLADKVTIVDWANPYNRVESFAFDDGSSLNEQSILDLLATSGDDALAVSGGTAELRGGAGNDTLEGGNFEETLAGGAGDDSLKGGGSNDTYRFGRGDGLDTLHDFGTDQVANGTEKVEIFSDKGTFDYKLWYAQSIRGWNIAWAQKNQKGTYDARYYEIVDTYADVAVDGGARDVLQFGAGIHVHDLMLRQVGDDLIVGVGDRNDPALTFELLSDKITIKDWFLDISRIEIFDFEDGFTLDLGAIIAEVGLDAAALENWLQTAVTVTPEGGYIVQGTTGDERFTGTQFADTLDGAGGDDLLVGEAGDDSLVGETGADTLEGGDGNDVLDGGVGNDVLEAGAGDDTLVAGLGADSLSGGEGQDKAVFSGLVSNHTIQLTAEGATVVDLTAPESASTNLLTGIESVQFDDRVIDLTGTTNNAPVAVDGFAQLPVDTTVTGKLKAWDLDGDDLTYSIQNNAASGTAVVQADGSFIYTYDPNTGFEGMDSFEFQVMDSEGNTDTGTVSIEVFREVTGDNTAVGTTEQQVNTFTAGDQHGSAVAGFSDGSYVTVWYSNGQEDGVSGNNGIYGQRFASDGTPAGSEFLINQATAPNQFDPQVAILADDSFVVTWTSFDQNPGSNEIYARHYSSNGVALGGEFQVNTTTAQAQRESSVAALAGGGFVVTWTDWAQDGSGTGVYAQRYDSAAQAVGGEFHVNEDRTHGDQDHSQAIGLANGGFVVVWETGSASENVMARIYDSEGVPLTWEETIVGGGSSDGDSDGDSDSGGSGSPETYTVQVSEIVVNEDDLSGRQGVPAVAALAGGDFVVIWHSDHGGGTNHSWGINGQRFSETGERVGPEFDVNTTLAGAQVLPSVVGLSDGSFVVAWQSDGQGSSLEGVYLQVFDPDGNKEGPEIQVNEYQRGDQTGIKVTALPDGDFAVSWTSWGQDGAYLETDEDGEVSTEAGGQDGVYTRIFTRTPHRNAFGFGPGDDAIVGTQHGDQLSGGGGDDFITGAGGADTIDGGVGQDLVSFAGSAAGVSVDLASGAGAGGDAEGDSLTSIEHLLGSDHADSLSGDQGDNTIIGGVGEDSLSGAEGADSLFGDAGDDTLTGGKGDDHLSGGDGLDTAVFSGEAVDYDIQINGNEATVTDLRTDGDGIDSLVNVERAQFADRVIHLDGTNNAPIMVDDFNSTAEDTALRISPVLLLWDDFDLEGDTFSLTGVGDAVGGSVEIDPLGVVVFTPDQDFEGEASFSYTATDSHGASHSAKVVVDVAPVNDAPVGIHSVVKVAAGSLVQGRATVTDVDAVDAHSFELQSGPNAGSVQVYADGTYDYVPDSGFVGYDSFVVLIRDSGGLTSQAIINVEVRPSAEAAETLVGSLGNDVLHGGAGADSLEGGTGDDVLEGGSGGDTLNGGEGFDTAVLSGFAADYEITIDGNQATVRDLRDGSPDGTDQLVDIERLWFRGDRALYIDGTNNAPVGVGAAALLPVDTLGNGRVTAWDYEGDALTFALDEGPQHGSVTVGEDGSYSYTPAAGFTGTDSFTVTVTDENGASDTSEVSVEVIADPNGESLILTGSAGQDLFVGGSGDDLLEGRAAGDDLDGGAGNDTASYEGSGLGVSIDLETGLGAGGDAEGDRLSSIENLMGSGFDDTLAGDSGDNVLDGGAGIDIAVFDGNAADYSVEVLADRVIVTDLRVGGTDGQDTLRDVERLRFSDRTFNLSAGGNAPVAVDSMATTPKDDAVSGRLTAWDIDGGALGFAEEGTAIGGTVIIHSDGRYDFTPDAGFEGEASFSYTVTDSDGQTSTTTISLQIGGNRTDAYASQGEVIVNTEAWGNQHEVALAALADGGFVAVWEDEHAEGYRDSGIRAQRYDKYGSVVGSEISVNSQTWEDQRDAAVTALSDGGFVVVWMSDVFPESEIRAQRYGSDGTPVGAEVLVSPDDHSDHHQPKVVGLADGGYLVVWAGQGGQEQYHARRFNALGQSVGGIIDVAEVNHHYSEPPNPPAVASLEDGGFVVVWQDFDEPAEDYYVLAQRYDASGAAVGDEISVSGIATYDQDSAAVMGLPTGGFVVVWETGTGSSNEIVGQVFDAEGIPQGDVFPINTYSLGNQNNPAISLLDDGGFIVTWTSRVSNSYEIRAQRYDAASVPVGEEFQVNDYTSGAQYDPAIAGLLDGGFAIAWESNGQDGDDYGVVAKLFRPVFGTEMAVVGSVAGDMLVGGAGADSLMGAGGADTLLGAAGADTLDGGDGSDTASYEASAAAVNIDLTAGTASGGDAAGDVLTNIENLVGSGQGDVLTGDGLSNLLEGGDGDDTLDGADGTDTLIGGTGADVLDGGTGFDTASYENSAAAVSIDLAGASASGGDAAGDSLSNIEGLVGSDFADSLQGSTAGNKLRGGVGADTLGGAGGADTLLGGLGDDSLSGGGEDDVLVGGAGADTLAGGGGSDLASYEGSTGGVSVDLAAGTASGGDATGDVLTGIENLAGSGHADSLTGDAVANRLAGRDGDDSLAGGAGSDTLVGGAGADVLSGGADVDTASYEDALQGVSADLGGTAGSGDAAGDIFADIENLSGSNHDDTLSGDAGANVVSGQDGGDILFGREGNDSLLGGAGNDVLEGGSGTDVLDGGAGSDAASYQGSSAAVCVDLGAGTLAGGDAEGDSLIGIENVIGSDYADTLIGDAAANVLEGLGGDDTLSGGAGDDALFGDGGADILDGGAGADFIDGGDGFDVVTYESSTSGVSVNLEQGSGAGGDAEGDVLTGVEDVVGSGDDDTLVGDGLENSLSGGAGADVIDGGFGDDTLVGGLGADTLEGSLGYDIASYEDSAAAIAVDLYGGTADGGTAAGDSLSGIEGISATAFDDTLAGDDEANWFRGGEGQDAMAAAAGDDTLIGGAGADTLDGGDGFDTVRYDESAAAVAVDLAFGTGLGGDAEGDTLSAVEAVFGSSHNDTLTGDGSGNLFVGQSGNDSLDGGAGNDTLVGDEGADSLVGGAGDDTLMGGVGADSLSGGEGDHDLARYDLSDAGVAVDLGAGTAAGGHAAGDSISGVEHLIGSAFDDTLAGDAAGNDLIGGAGDDLLRGGLGADTLDGGFGDDTASYENSMEGVRVDLAEGLGVGGSAAGDTYFSIENLVGSAYDDTLSGGAGSNTIDGGAGTDSVVFSGAAADYLVTTGPDGTITVSDQRVSGADGDDHLIGIERLVFADRTIDLTSGVNAPVALDTSVVFQALSGVTSEVDGWDADGDSVTVTVVSDPLYGIVVVNANGSFTYTPNPGFRGTDSFTYTAMDADGVSNMATVTLEASNDAPLLLSSIVALASDQVMTGQFEAFDADGDPLTYELNSAPTLGVAEVSPDGSYSYTPAANATGTDSFTVIVTDERGLSTTATVSVVLADPADVLTAVGGMGPDTMLGGGQDDNLAGGGGDDRLTGNAGADSLDGGDGADSLTGGSGTDSLLGGNGDDTLSGGDDADVLDGGLGRDRLLGGSGSDSLVGGDDSDTLVGGYHEDLLYGDAGNDLIYGGDDNDTLYGGDGGDTLDGGDEDDLLLGGEGDDRLEGDRHQDTLYGGDGGDTLDGGRDNDVLYGDDGYDYLKGGDDNDTLYGGDGGDTLDGGDEDDLLLGGEGDDRLEGDRHQDTLYGGDGGDTLDGGRDNDVLYGDDGYDYLKGGDDDDTLYGGDGGDTLYGGDEDDLLLGGEGDDRLEGDRHQDTLYGGIGDDTLDGGWNNDILYGDDGNDYLKGNDENDVLYGGIGDDTLEGGARSDTLIGGSGGDLIDGGSSDDLASYITSSAAVNVDLLVGSANGGDATGDTLVSIENLVGSAFDDTLTAGANDARLYGGQGNDILTGSDDDDLLMGEDGLDTLVGGAGDDTLYGGAGADSLAGGSGVDVVLYDLSTAGVSVNLSTGTVSGGDATGDIISGFENLTGSQHDDALTGDAFANTLDGLGGVDSLSGGAGDDELRGGAGADVIDGGVGSDTASYSGSSAAVTVDLSTGSGNGGDAAGDFLIGIENLKGSSRNDTLTGDSNANSLSGSSGDDVLFGAGGNDTLDGGSGDDLLYGGVGNDSLIGDSYSIFTTEDTLYGGLGDDTLSGGKSNDRLFGDDGNDILRGGDGGDVLYGGIGNDDLQGNHNSDKLFGGDGLDTLFGGDRNDTLSGGAGNDLYRFNLGDDQDVIDNQDAVSTDDRLLFGSGIAPEDLWFQQDGNDLRISVLGTSDKVTFTDWYLDAGQEIDVLETSSGETLLNSEVDQLVSAMAAFNPTDGTDPADLYDNNLPASVQTVVASSWQSPA
ncbi:Ig-like domain-containing protein [Pelagibius sp.]|uniref:Ig-like domain-containing protein n=1 Tax=Pelagibius sp. TaxID=1931238 RepID=UPI003BB2185F